MRTIGPALTLALAAASIFYDELRGDEKFETWECFFFLALDLRANGEICRVFVKKGGLLVVPQDSIFLVGVQEGNA